MTLPDIIQRLAVGIMRDDLAALYPGFVNEALVEIQRRRSWLAMKQLGAFTITTGNSSVALATDDDGGTTGFKELTVEQSPVHLQNSLDPANPGVLTPCEVWSREKILRRQARLISNSLLYSVYSHPETARRISVPVWIAWEAETPVLNILYTAQNNLPFVVSYFGYLPDLTNDANPTNSNYFTRNYPEMVVAKSKSLAFEAINDPASADFEALFERKFREAAAQDAYQFVAGMQLRM